MRRPTIHPGTRQPDALRHSEADAAAEVDADADGEDQVTIPAGERYRALFEAIDAGFCIVKLLFDEGRAVDYRFVEVNPKFEDQTGLTNAVGRTASDLVPDLEPFWFETYGRVATTGIPARFEQGSETMGRWFDVHAFRVGDPGAHKVAILFNDTTDRHRAMRAIRESEERLNQALAVGNGIGTWDWDVRNDRITADDRFSRLYGVPLELGRKGAPLERFLASVHPDDLPATRNAIADVLEAGGEFYAEYRLVQPDGAVRWVVGQGRCRLAPDNTPVRFAGVSFDITDRKQAALRQQVLLDLSDTIRDLSDPDAIAYAACESLGAAFQVDRIGYGVVDHASGTIAVARDWTAPGVTTRAGTRSFEEYAPYIDTLKTGRIVAVSDVDRDDRMRDAAEDLRAAGARSFVEIPLLEQDDLVALLYANHAGMRVWTDADLVLMREVAERVRAATERLKAEEARRVSDDQFRAFAEAVPNQIWAARPDGQVFWLNEQSYAYHGLARGSLDDIVLADLIHPDDYPMVHERWTQSRTTGARFEAEMRLRGKDGIYRWFLSRAEAVRAADGSVLRWLGSTTDIDEGRRQAAQLAELNATLEDQLAARTRELMETEEALRQSQKMEAVGQLTGGIAHDFNNLLTGITGSLELLGIRIAQGRLADVERYSLAAQGAAKRAAALTHRLLAFSRRQTLDPKPTDVNRLVAGLDDLVRRTVGPGIEVDVVEATDLWATLVDPNQLENVLLNLCINARDAMPDGGRLTIETANRTVDACAAQERDLAAGQYVSLCVSDTGTGMPAEVIAKAFDPFFTTKPLGLGTGLGLSMIYGFVRQSGGYVGINSEVDRGTSVCVYLPRHVGAVEQIDSDPGLNDAPRARAGETVLVVDDEPTVRMLVMEVLDELGYAAIEAADGAAGLKLLQSDIRIYLLITDVGLPGGMNGRQMADAARIGRPDLRILFITGYAENGVVGNGHLEPGMHVMTKPFPMEALANRIKELIAAR